MSVVTLANTSGERGAHSLCAATAAGQAIAFGVTHHKSQGGTLDKVVLNIGNKVNNDGQSFIAFSRCRELENMILEDFAEERITKIRDSASFARLGALDRLRQLENAKAGCSRTATFGSRVPRPECLPLVGRGGGRGTPSARGRGVQTTMGGLGRRELSPVEVEPPYPKVLAGRHLTLPWLRCRTV